MEKKVSWRTCIPLACWVILSILLWSDIHDATACSCVWRGPFLSVAPQAEGIIRARVLGYHGRARGIDLAMDVEVLEVLSGPIHSRRLRIWGDNGMLCRPGVDRFPPGSEWILALNGPGSKPAYEGHGLAVSVCGTYWLEVRKGAIHGNMDNARDREAGQSVPLGQFRERLAAALHRVPAGDIRREERFTGEVAFGKPYVHIFGPGFRFVLEPDPSGWTIRIHDPGGTDDLSRLTPPLHFVPNPRIIESRHFMDRQKLDEQDGQSPGMMREFIFSPAVGRTIDGPGASRAPTPEEIEEIGRFGRGQLRITESRLENGGSAETARLSWIRFEASLSWPSQ